MSMSNAAEATLLDHYFLNTTIPNVGDATGLRGSSAAGSFYIRLHSADPGEAGDGSTSEITYTGYAAVAVARDGTGFTRAISTISNAALVQFPTCSGGTSTATYFSICLAATGAAVILLSGTLGAPLSISAGIQPQFAIGALTATVD